MTRFSTVVLRTSFCLMAVAVAGSRLMADQAVEQSSFASMFASETKGATSQEPEVIKERFPNGRVRIEREVVQDEDENYVNHGSWRMWDQEGRKVAEGHYRHGERDGLWTAWFFRSESKMFSQPPYSDYSGPFISQAEFKNGRLHGNWIIYDSKQRKISQFSYADGQRHGTWTWWYPSGKKMKELTYEDGDVVGEARSWDQQGQATASDLYEEGRKLGRYVKHDKDGQVESEGTYLYAKRVPQGEDDWWNAKLAPEVVIGQDEKHGPWVTRYNNGQKQMHGEYRHNLEVGRFVWWHENGQKSVDGTFTEGRKTGKWTWWHPNGQKASQGFFDDGAQVGKWTFWRPDGKVNKRADFSNADLRVVETPSKDVELESALPAEKRKPPVIKR